MVKNIPSLKREVTMTNTPETGNNALMNALTSKAAMPPARTELRAGKLFGVGRRDNDFASLAGFLRKKGADAEQIQELLGAIDSTLEHPHGEGNLGRISQSISRYEIKPDIFTHDQFSKLLASEMGGYVRYCEGQGFLVYQDGYWQRDGEDLRVIAEVRVILDKVRAQIERIKPQIDAEQHKKLFKASRKLESAGFMRESIKLMKSDPAMRVAFNQLDEKRHLINLENGTFNLQTFELQPFNPEDLLTFKLNFEYKPEADCPLFRKFLGEILSPEVGSFMARLFGYALEGHGREQAYFIFHGIGKNGKSTLMETVTDIFGQHVITMQPDTLNGKKDGQVRNDLARLAGKRIMLTSETRQGTVMDAPLLKQITGQDVLTARLLFKEYFEFRPCCVPIIVTNFMPVMSGDDMAMSRRLHIVSFQQVIQTMDKQLPVKLLEEKSGIFNWMLQGLRDYRAQGLDVPNCISERSTAFMRLSNLIQSFADDCLVPVESGKLYATHLYKGYSKWCEEHGYRPMSMNQLKESLERVLGCQQERDNQGRFWSGWRLQMSL
jgi:putative DNA primase/helicase